MRLPRFVLALALLGTPVAAVSLTATSASADPFTYTALSVATRNACAVTPEGVVLCWGDNPERWVFADRPAGAVPTPTRIALPNGQKWKSINVGDGTTICGLSETHRAWCWGNHHLGSYFTTTSRTPVEVEFASGVTLLDVQSGYSTACARTSTRELWCWGDAHYLGDGSTEPVRIPVRIPMPDQQAVTSFAIGPSGVCAVTTSPNMYCWGSNGDGELGLGYAQQYSYNYSWRPVLIPPPTGEQWSSATVGLERICALTESGKGYCAGRNWEGSFGNNTYSNSTRFTQMIVPNNERISHIEAGWYHTCILTESQKMWCAGRGQYGELGTGTTLGGYTWRAPFVPSGVSFTTFSAGVAGTCALDTTSRVWCWGGLNWGSQGTGRVNATLFPELIAPVGSPSVISTGTTSVDAERATITGSVNPNGYNTTVSVDVSTSSTFAQSRRATVPVSLPDNSFVASSFSINLSALEPRTTHYVRIVATNTLGTITGNTTSFTTLGDVPSVEPATATDITGNEATLSVTINPNRLLSTASFHIAQDETFTQNFIEIPVDSLTGSVALTRTVDLSDLTPNTRYFIRARSTNRLGTTLGNTASFTTVGSLPTATITSTSATTRSISVNATVTTGLARGEVFAEVSTSPAFTSVVRSESQSFTSRGPTHHVFTFSTLTPRTDYWVRIVATNQVGSNSSPSQQQRTRGGAPTVVISRIDADTRSAIAHVTFDTTGLTTFVTLSVSENADMSNATEYFVSSGAYDWRQSVPVSLSGLSPRKKYFVEASARNDAGSVTTATSDFTTLTPLGVLINDDNDETDSTTVSLTITAPSAALAYRISNHADFKNAKVFSPTSPIRWELLASDEPSVDRTVYVQVYLTNRTSIVYTDTITLISDVTIPDEEAPVIESLRATRTKATAQASSNSSRRRSQVNISIRDARSGVTRIEMKTGKRVLVTRVDAVRRGSYSLAMPTGVSRVQIRVRDAAGNYSRWRTVSVR